MILQNFFVHLLRDMVDYKGQVALPIGSASSYAFLSSRKKVSSMSTYISIPSAKEIEQENEYWAPVNTHQLPQELFLKARDFLQLFYQEQRPTDSLASRLAEIQSEIEERGSYRQTPDELA